ncbi:unnamed protein product [Cyclocybe aegerita]|uniref:F-box domain-containing protein n=1 Tax=Cyclocybe aegerita TaxID=1973307 RepID=A0A8S0W6X5_CYCAE|nr:unnamed protein product [Cyclocybe aegerita]
MLCDLCQASDVRVQSGCEVDEGAPCNPCLKIVDLDAQISNVRAVLKRLTDARRIFQTERNYIHDPIARNFPPEIISRIFSLYSHPHGDDTSPDKEDLHPLILGAVCKTWRGIAWNTTELWTRLSISVDPYIKKNIVRERQMTFEWLARAGNLPLSLYMDRVRWDISNLPSSSLRQVTIAWATFIRDLLNEFGTCCRVLDVQLPVKIFFTVMPTARFGAILKRLVIHLRPCDDPHEVFSPSADPPRPENVSLKYLPPHVVNISWSNVTELTLDGCLESACLDIFNYTPSLLSCQFGKYVLLSDQPPSPQFITHSRLRRLVIRHATDQILKRCIFPELKYLSMNYAAVATIQDFVSRSYCNLKTLEITPQFRAETENSLFQLLQNPSLQSLQSLSITPSGSPASHECIFNALSESPAFLPELRSLTYSARSCLQFSWVVALVLSTEFRPLSTIKLSCPDNFIEGDALLRHLFEICLRHPGITLDFLDTSPDFWQIQAMRLGLEYPGIDK